MWMWTDGMARKGVSDSRNTQDGGGGARATYVKRGDARPCAPETQAGGPCAEELQEREERGSTRAQPKRTLTEGELALADSLAARASAGERRGTGRETWHKGRVRVRLVVMRLCARETWRTRRETESREQRANDGRLGNSRWRARGNTRGCPTLSLQSAGHLPSCRSTFHFAPKSSLLPSTLTSVAAVIRTLRFAVLCLSGCRSVLFLSLVYTYSDRPANRQTLTLTRTGPAPI